VQELKQALVKRVKKVANDGEITNEDAGKL